jgi:predicted SnoaL-like aldol condensation-catalyzing enzyme
MRTRHAIQTIRSLATLVLLASITACGAPAPASEDAASTAQAASGRRPANDRLVDEALDALFVDLDADAVDRYLAPTYIEHDPLFATGVEPQRTLIHSLASNPAFKYERLRTIGHGDYVAVHGVITGFFPLPAAVFDLFRVENGRLAEHWDVIQQTTAPNPSGHTMLDGTTKIRAHGHAARNAELATCLVDTVLVSGQVDRLPDFVAPTYIQHNPGVGDGLAPVEAFLGDAIKSGFHYTHIHHVVAEGDFVVVESEATANGATLALFDMWRVENDKMVEHWDVIQPVPATSANANGFF